MNTTHQPGPLSVCLGHLFQQRKDWLRENNKPLYPTGNLPVRQFQLGFGMPVVLPFVLQFSDRILAEDRAEPKANWETHSLAACPCVLTSGRCPQKSLRCDQLFWSPTFLCDTLIVRSEGGVGAASGQKGESFEGCCCVGRNPMYSPDTWRIYN